MIGHGRSILPNQNSFVGLNGSSSSITTEDWPIGTPAGSGGAQSAKRLSPVMRLKEVYVDAATMESLNERSRPGIFTLRNMQMHYWRN